MRQMFKPRVHWLL